MKLGVICISYVNNNKQLSIIRGFVYLHCAIGNGLDFSAAFMLLSVKDCSFPASGHTMISQLSLS